MRLKNLFFAAAALVLFAGALPASLQLGVKFPIALGTDFTFTQGPWFGFFTGGGVHAEIMFMENAFGADTALGIAGFGMFSYERYALPSPPFSLGTYIQSLNIRYGLDVKMYLAKNLYVGVGGVVRNTFAGEQGDTTVRYPFTANQLGNDIGACVLAGYCIAVSENMFIPIELKANMFFTAVDALPCEFQANVGLIFML